MKKKIVSAVVALCLVLGSTAALPQNAFIDSTSISVSAASTSTSGKCGDNVSWTLKDGVLTISGTGDMYYYNNYDPYNTSPFYERTDIKSVVIKHGVTNVGLYTFQDCSNITSISIPASVKVIDDSAFKWGTTNLEKIEVDSNNKDYTTVDGVLYDKKVSYLYFCPQAKKDISIPNTVQHIDSFAFYKCRYLKNITLPKGLLAIGQSAFDSCTSLETVVIPSTVSYMDLDYNMFDGCVSLVSIDVDSDNTIVSSIDGVLYNKEKTTLLLCPNRKESITIPETVTSIDDNAFYSDDHDETYALLTSIDVDANNKVYSSDDGMLYSKDGTTLLMCPRGKKSAAIADHATTIAPEAFYACTSLESVSIPDSVVIIGEDAFWDCTKLTGITIPNKVTNIESGLFWGCESLESVNIPASVSTISADAFNYCEKLESINVDSNNQNYCTVDGALYNKDITTLVKCPAGKDSIDIPSTVKTIGNNAFQSCDKLTSFTIPVSVTSIGDNAFESCTKLSSITIPDSVTSIGEYAFDYCENLKSVTLPESMTNIADGMFQCCSNLTSVTIPSSVTSIGKSAFDECKNLTNINIPIGVTSIGDYTFGYCESLESITVPECVTEIGAGAFYGCSSLKSINIPDGVTTIGSSAFSDCSSLKTINIPDSVKSIGYSAFNNCRSLKSATLSKSIKVLAGSVFEDCSSLTSITIPDGVETISSCALSNCTSLKSVTIPGSVTYIWDDSFEGHSSDDFAIYGKKGSYAENFAKKNGEIFIDSDVVSRLAGDSRFDTAVEISKANFEKADTIVLAYGLNYADALAGVPLASSLNAPILLTNKDTIGDETLTEIKRLGAKNVVILGGEGAVSGKVADALVGNGIAKDNIERIAGSTRYGTATAVAEKLTKTPTDVFFVYGNGFADALSVSAVAAAKGAPIIYLNTKGELDKATADYLASIKGSVKNAYVIGGTGVISDDMMKKAGKALGVTPTRVFGANRFETCVAVNEKFASVLSGESMCIATGVNFPDALAGGVFAAQKKAPLFLASGKLSDVQKAYIKAKAPKNLYVFGGTGAVANKLVDDIAQI